MDMQPEEKVNFCLGTRTNSYASTCATVSSSPATENDGDSHGSGNGKAIVRYNYFSCLDTRGT